jgi:1-acyl-sn-glycerol-3-phosphate acyltransferase
MVYTISFFIARYFTKIVFGGEGFGHHNFPKKKPFIVIFNHNSNFDIFTLALVSKFRGIGMGKYELFKVPVLGWWLKKIGVYPIIRGSADTEGFELIENQLRKGDVLFISPEGTRKWENGAPPRPKLGFIRLAQVVKCPIIPVAISGTRNILPPGSTIPKWQKVTVRVGEPIKLVPIEIKTKNRNELQLQANEVMRRVYKLLPIEERPKSVVFEDIHSNKSSLILP